MSANRPVDSCTVRIQELLEAINERRKPLGASLPTIQLDEFRARLRRAKDPQTLRALLREIEETPLGHTAGLAFSGGGARAACVSLGFVQALARKLEESPRDRPFDFPSSLLRQFDYLSTVSGGGYTGSLLSSLATQKLDDKATEAKEVLASIDPAYAGDACAAVAPLAKEATPGAQPLAQRMAARGLLIGKIGLFLSRQLASTLLFDLMLLTGLLLVAGSAALLWRMLDTPPFIEFIWWVSDREVREYNRPFLIPVAFAISWLLVALSRADSNLGMRILGVGLTSALLAMWLGTTFVYATAVCLSFVCLILALRSTGQYRTFARTWAGLALLALLTILILALTQEYVNTFQWFLLVSALLFAVQLVIVSALAVDLEKSLHRGAAASLLYVTAGSAVISAAIWLATPNMNFVAQPRNDTLGSQQWIQYVLAIVSALILPFLRPKELIKSGLPTASPTKRWIFNFASAGLLVGVPFLLVYYLGRHNISGYDDNPARPWSRSDLSQNRYPDFCRLLVRERAQADFEFLGFKVFHPTPATVLMTRLGGAGDEDSQSVLAWIHSRQYRKLPAVHRRQFPFFPVPERTWQQEQQLIREEEAFASSMTAIASDPTFSHAVLDDAGFLARLEDLLDQEDPRGNALADAKKKNRDQLRQHLKDWKTLVEEAPSSAIPEDKLTPIERILREECASLGNLLCYVYYSDHLAPLGYVRRPIVISHDQQFRAMLLAFVLIVFIICAFVVDINWTSAQSFYERQLELAYLRIEAAEPKSVPLHKLANTYFGLPYHILSGGVDCCDPKNEPETQLRGFLFSKLYCGAEGIGYRDTESYLKRRVRGEEDGLQLAHAMSISGAAVSPMRLEGNWLLRVVLTVINFRLGQWLPKPAAKNRQPHVSLFTLASSLFEYWLPPWKRRATADESCHVVFVADGGFYENLGVEPLMERRCRFIVALDAGADPTSTFADFDRLHRRLRQSGIRLELLEGLTVVAADDPEGARRGNGSMRLDAVTPHQLAPEPAGVGKPAARASEDPAKAADKLDPAVYSPSHFVFARIKYPDAPDGLLVYVKSTMTGDEDVDLKMYHRTRRPFPHHPTSEQLLDSQMVDAYRELGLHMGERLCATLAGWRPLPWNETDVIVRDLLDLDARLLSPQLPATPAISRQQLASAALRLADERLPALAEEVRAARATMAAWNGKPMLGVEGQQKLVEMVEKLAAHLAGGQESARNRESDALTPTASEPSGVQLFALQPPAGEGAQRESSFHNLRAAVERLRSAVSGLEKSARSGAKKDLYVELHFSTEKLWTLLVDLPSAGEPCASGCGDVDLLSALVIKLQNDVGNTQPLRGPTLSLALRRLVNQANRVEDALEQLLAKQP